MAWQAKWIWALREDYQRYNDTIRARKTFALPEFTTGSIRITADTSYRLFVNGEWAGDGPCRSWPNHYQYDLINVTPYLQIGENTVEIIAKFYGIGTFHEVPQQAGLLAQFEVEAAGGGQIVVGTDTTWETCTAGEYASNVPKSSVQMSLFEQVDARLAGPREWSPAVALHPAGEGPWKHLMPRDVALLTRLPFALRRFQHAVAVEPGWRCFDFNLARALYGGEVVYANNHVSMAHAVATVLENEAPLELHLPNSGYGIVIDGVRGQDDRWRLEPGRHLICAVLDRYFTHWATDMWIRFEPPEGYVLEHPLHPDHTNPWALLPCPELRYAMADFKWELLDDSVRQEFTRKVRRTYAGIHRAATSVESFVSEYAEACVTLPPDEFLMDEANAQFQSRRVLEERAVSIAQPEALMADDDAVTEVQPAGGADVELLYDLGEQNCGYYHFDLEAPAGTVVDVFGVEYIRESDGAVQHTGPYRNGMRYICKEGRNELLALRRRSQRHLFLTLRNMTGPVRIRHFGLIESTYPTDFGEGFSCSDEALTEIWRISARTLKLCMEDTYTDCPLYEQTLWVGDARNEGLYGLECLGAYDITERCIRLAAESLELYPIVLCQVPSTWERLLPNWSFLWVLSVHDYYAWTGDKALVERTWPAIMENLRGAEGYVAERDLFSGPFWNMFDWSGIDDSHRVVLHNSMFLCGAAKRAHELAVMLGNDGDAEWLAAFASRLEGGINATWDDGRGAYPDSIHENGNASPRTCIHSQFLSLLYDIVPEEHRERAIALTLDPPEDMTGVGSPFAIQYLYETLDKLGETGRIIASIRENYQPMLDLGATTVWESFSAGTTGRGEWPTRSHSHAWSSSPMLYFNRILLGIRPTSPGFATCNVSPRPNGLTQAKGFACTPRGKLHVSWTLENGTLAIETQAPPGIQPAFLPNDSISAYKVTWNGEEIA